MKVVEGLVGQIIVIAFGAQFKGIGWSRFDLCMQKFIKPWYMPAFWIVEKDWIEVARYYGWNFRRFEVPFDQVNCMEKGHLVFCKKTNECKQLVRPIKMKILLTTDFCWYSFCS